MGLLHPTIILQSLNARHTLSLKIKVINIMTAWFKHSVKSHIAPVNADHSGNDC